jgi:hypothetical protein
MFLPQRAAKGKGTGTSSSLSFNDHRRQRAGCVAGGRVLTHLICSRVVYLQSAGYSRGRGQGMLIIAVIKTATMCVTTCTQTQVSTQHAALPQTCGNVKGLWMGTHCA